MIFKRYFCQGLLMVLSFIILEICLVIRRVLNRKIKFHRKSFISVSLEFRPSCKKNMGFLQGK